MADNLTNWSDLGIKALIALASAAAAHLGTRIISVSRVEYEKQHDVLDKKIDALSARMEQAHTERENSTVKLTRIEADIAFLRESIGLLRTDLRQGRDCSNYVPKRD